MFEYFPGDYASNLSVALGMAMGAQVGEVDRACRPLVGVEKDDPRTKGEASFESWMQLAGHVAALAGDDDLAGNATSSSSKRFRAATCFLLAERTDRRA